MNYLLGPLGRSARRPCDECHCRHQNDGATSPFGICDPRQLYSAVTTFGGINRSVEAARPAKSEKVQFLARRKNSSRNPFSTRHSERQIPAETCAIRGIRGCHRRVREVSRTPAGGAEAGSLSGTGATAVTFHPLAGYFSSPQGEVAGSARVSPTCGGLSSRARQGIAENRLNGHQLWHQSRSKTGAAQTANVAQSFR